MRAKRQRPWKPDFDTLPARWEGLVGGSAARQLQGEMYVGNALRPPLLREPGPALALNPYRQTEFHYGALECAFPVREEPDLLEQSYKVPVQQLTVLVKPPALSLGSNGFSADENKLILEARAIGMSFEEIADLLPSCRSTAAVKRQSRFLTGARTSSVREPVQPSPQPELTLPEPAQPASSTKQAAMVNPYMVQREGGDAKILLKGNLPEPPRGFTGMAAHGLTSLAGVSFFEEAAVPDPDEPERAFIFNIREQNHCACFNIGLGEDGSPLISWSDLHAIYVLPDGSKWAEHGYFYDMDDLKNLAQSKGRSHTELMGSRELQPQELVKNKNRYHTRLSNIEYECWIYRDEVPEVWKVNGVWSPDAYFWTICFDPETMREVAA
mmetsp:Transcript_22004/g.61076  ORF Transcript_22004/g.61076 Transcript_22004/m.61076 type:complete len:383 (-) Transcript_22004:616-1764(-)